MSKKIKILKSHFPPVYSSGSFKSDDDQVESENKREQNRARSAEAYHSLFDLWSRFSIDYKNFLKYLAVGIFAMFLSTFLLWVFVDLLHFMASIMSIFTSLIIFFLKFFTYKKTNMFNDQANMIKYTFVWVVIVLINAGMLWLFVDMLNFWVVIVNPAVVVFIFLFRYYLFKILNMIS